MLPRLTFPLVKDIRTGEGILEWVLAVFDVVAGVTGNLSIAHTATYLTIIAAVKAVRRTLLKIVAIQAGVGVGDPTTPKILRDLGQRIESLVAVVEGKKKS